jgi:hypothetical protein
VQWPRRIFVEKENMDLLEPTPEGGQKSRDIPEKEVTSSSETVKDKGDQKSIKMTDTSDLEGAEEQKLAEIKEVRSTHEVSSALN